MKTKIVAFALLLSTPPVINGEASCTNDYGDCIANCDKKPESAQEQCHAKCSKDQEECNQKEQAKEQNNVKSKGEKK